MDPLPWHATQRQNRASANWNSKGIHWPQGQLNPSLPRLLCLSLSPPSVTVATVALLHSSAPCPLPASCRWGTAGPCPSKPGQRSGGTWPRDRKGRVLPRVAHSCTRSTPPRPGLLGGWHPHQSLVQPRAPPAGGCRHPQHLRQRATRHGKAFCFSSRWPSPAREVSAPGPPARKGSHQVEATGQRRSSRRLCSSCLDAVQCPMNFGCVH
jgi:hypothetical protein